MSKAPRYLLDINVLVALTSRSHVHHRLVRNSFYASASLQWSVCAFTEAGFLRNAPGTRSGQISMSEAHGGYGTKQVTDAYLLGLAVQSGLILVTMDKAILHLAGTEHRKTGSSVARRLSSSGLRRTSDSSEGID